MSESRVLVIDDDDDIRNLVRTLLERTGSTVHDAANGKEGLREFHSWRPDLVILDVNMPEMDGWNVLERIRDMSEVPVLMLTARGDELERVRGLQSGADDYVVKPFGKQELVARIQALLRRAARGASGEAEAESYADSFVSIDWGQARVTVGERERPAARPRLGRPLRRVRRPGEALRRLPPAQARPEGAGLGADRDRTGLRLPLQDSLAGVEQLAHARRELGRGERLLDVRVGAAGIAAPDIRLLRLRRQQQDARSRERLIATDLLEHLEAVEPGHADVEHGERGPDLARERERIVPAARRDHLVTVAPQPRRHEQEDVVVVVRDEDYRTHLVIIAVRTAGSSILKTAPPPSRGVAEIVPPCASVIAWAMKSPRPVPCTCPSIALSAR